MLRLLVSSTPSTCRLDHMYPDELQALEPNFVLIPDLIRQASPQKPSYKVNDSDDTDLVEIISPLSDLKRNLARGKSLTTSRQFCHSNYSVTRGESSPPKPHFKKPQHHDPPRNNAFHGLHNLELLGLGSHSSKPKLVQRTTFKEGTKKVKGDSPPFWIFISESLSILLWLEIEGLVFLKEEQHV